MNKNISILELNALIYFLIRSTCIGFTVFSVIYLAHNNAFLSVFLSTLIGLPFLFLIYRLLKKNIKLNFISKVVSSILIFFLLCILFWDLINFISTEYLYNTPKIVIGLALILPLYYINIRDEQVIGRVGLILFYVSLALYIIMILSLFFQIKIDNFLPFMKINYKNFGISIFSNLIYILTPILLIIKLPVDHDRLSFKKILPGYILGCISVIGCILLIIGIYGYRLSLILNYPAFQVLKRISIGFFERIEHFIFIQWIFDIFICLSLGVSYIKRNFFNNKNFCLFLCVFIMIISLFLNRNILYIVYYIPLILFINILLFLIIKKEA